MARIIFTGSQGVGKTTILGHYKEQGHGVITEVVRNLALNGVNINEYGNEEGQKIIFDTYKDLLSNKEPYISDRGLTDVLAYTYELYTRGKVSHDEVQREINELMKFNHDNPDVMYMYFPIEFPVVDDGVRSTDESYRETIDKNILSILKQSGVSWVTVTGTVDDRIGIVDRTMVLADITP